MVVDEIFHTCSNPHLARAALASIGGEFSARFASEASRNNASPGAHAALVVRAFADRASRDDRDGVWRAARGADQPILAGLKHILGRAAALL
jgi:hypothetical protein